MNTYRRERGSRDAKDLTRQIYKTGNGREETQTKRFSRQIYAIKDTGERARLSTTFKLIHRAVNKAKRGTTNTTKHTEESRVMTGWGVHPYLMLFPVRPKFIDGCVNLTQLDHQVRGSKFDLQTTSSIQTNSGINVILIDKFKSPFSNLLVRDRGNIYVSLCVFLQVKSLRL